MNTIFQDPLKWTNKFSKNYEVVFDNGGGATLQDHSGEYVFVYDNMDKLAHDVFQLLCEDDPSLWDSNTPECYIDDDFYYSHCNNGGLYAIQLDLNYHHTWPEIEEKSWYNINSFLKQFSNIQKNFTGV